MASAGTIASMNDEALVLVSYGSRGVIELPDGSRTKCRYRRSVGRPYCGDRVVVERLKGQPAVVTEILSRSNEFARANARKQKQVIAANLDQVLIVIAAAPEPSTDLVERYLVAVHSLGIRPVIVLNKSELMSGSELSVNSPLHHLDEYRDLGYELLTTSCKGVPGIDALLPILGRKTSILVGQSGVGKSSLVNALLPDLDLQTGELSRVTGKGIHTTTTTIMYNLSFGGKLIDSPGVWEYGLWEMEQPELVSGFIDFDPYFGHCKFNDCHHASEPECAIAEAVSRGEIREWRYESYRRLLEQSCYI
jgi:ribosome biogenesis GTPase